MKTNLDKSFKTNESYEKEGIWIEVSDDTAFRVRRYGGKNGQNIREAQAKYMKPHARKIENGTLSEKKENEVLTKFFVECCLIDWRGVEIDGVDTPFDKKIAIELFTNLPDLLSVIIEEAQKKENYLEVEREDLGNS